MPEKADSAFGGGMNERDQLREAARYITRLEAERDRYKAALMGIAYSEPLGETVEEHRDRLKGWAFQAAQNGSSQGPT